MSAYNLENIIDPAGWASAVNHCELRSYQSEALRCIYLGVLRRQGERFCVIFPRQSGKNETQAQLESLLLVLNGGKGGNIIKVIPTAKNQGKISRARLEKHLLGSRSTSFYEKSSAEGSTTCGNARLSYLSMQPNAAIVGATADLLLEVDEAQMVSPSKFDRDAAPMAASTNAPTVFWGTCWDDHTLLAREYRLALRDEEEGKGRHAFRCDAIQVGQEVPAYAEFIREKIAKYGREHPAIRTQYFCEEISDIAGMFSPERISLMRGTHRPLQRPEPDRCYIFLIDIAGSDELSLRARQESGFSDRRDATVLTICDVSLPGDPEQQANGPVWKVAARRYYRNLPAARLQSLISAEFERWNPRRALLDHTGLGCMLTSYLNQRFPGVVEACDITASVKTRMGWGFLAMVSTGRWQEYQTDELGCEPDAGFDPSRDNYEVQTDPAALQRMFFHEIRACRLDPSADGQHIRWGVPEGTRDPQTGRFIHDDLVCSAALSALAGDLPLLPALPEITPIPFLPDPVSRKRFR